MYSLIINLAVIPLMNFVYPAMLVAALTAPLAGHAGFFLYRFIEGILGFYEALCRLSLKLPGAAMITGQMSVPAICLLYGIFGAGAVFHHRARPAGARKKAGLFGSRLMLTFMRHMPAPCTPKAAAYDSDHGGCGAGRLFFASDS